MFSTYTVVSNRFVSVLDNRHEKTFLPAFDKSCKVLELYHVECAKVSQYVL